DLPVQFLNPVEAVGFVGSKRRLIIHSVPCIWRRLFQRAFAYRVENRGLGKEQRCRWLITAFLQRYPMIFNLRLIIPIGMFLIGHQLFVLCLPLQDLVPLCIFFLLLIPILTTIIREFDYITFKSANKILLLFTYLVINQYKIIISRYVGKMKCFEGGRVFGLIHQENIFCKLCTFHAIGLVK